VSVLLLAACGLGAGDRLPPGQGDLVVAYGARGDGEIEPCGCPKRPLGGLARRNTVIEQERATGADLVVEAGGSLAAELADPAADLDQRRAKASLIARAWHLAGVDAVAFSEADWALGTAFLREVVRHEELPVLAANLTCDGVAPFPASRKVTTPQGTVGVVGVATGAVGGCVVGDPRAALERAVAELGRVDLVLGLLPFDQDGTLRPVLEDGLGIDVAIDARGRVAGIPAEKIGTTWLVGAGTGARSVALLTMSLDPARTGWAPAGLSERVTEKQATARERVASLETRLQNTTLDAPTRKRLEQQRDGYRRQIDTLEAEITALAHGTTQTFTTRTVDLDDQIPDQEATAAAVAETKRAITVAASGGVDPATFVPRTVGQGPYFGGEGCVSCHKSEHAQWSQTGHARAWNALVAADRALDTECWSCHVTGAGQPGGPPSAAASGPWRDVQCEACHGPSRDHAASPATVDSIAVPPLETCTTCHDGERDGGRFHPPTYVPKVVHMERSRP
jgi:hypothetical protein